MYYLTRLEPEPEPKPVTVVVAAAAAAAAAIGTVVGMVKITRRS